MPYISLYIYKGAFCAIFVYTIKSLISDGKSSKDKYNLASDVFNAKHCLAIINYFSSISAAIIKLMNI